MGGIVFAEKGMRESRRGSEQRLGGEEGGEAASGT